VRLRAPGDFAGFPDFEDAAAEQPHRCAINRCLFIRNIRCSYNTLVYPHLINCEPAFRLYRLLRAVKVLLAALCSTLTVLAPCEETVVIGSRGTFLFVSKKDQFMRGERRFYDSSFTTDE
jgi:hypothetical protein